MDFLTIDGTPIPIAEGGATERILRAGGLSRMWLGNLRNGIRWEVSTYQVRTSLLTNAEAMLIRRLVAGGREVTCAGSIIDPAGGTLACRVLVTDGAVVTTQATDDGSHVMRTLALEVHPVNAPVLFAYVPRRSIADATYSRASTAAYRTEAGLLAQAAAGELRNRHFVLNPVTGLYERATRVEESRTNIALQSEDFAAAVWGKTNLTVIANATAAPDGTMTADRLEVAATAGATLTQAAVATATAHTYSLWLKAGTGGTAGGAMLIRNGTTAVNLVAATLDFANGTLTGVSGAARLIAYPNGWYRVTLSASAGISVGDTLIIYAGFTGGVRTAGEHVYLWGAMIEPGPFASAYVPTTGAAATRASDALKIPFAAKPQSMTVYAKFVEGGTILGPSSNAVVWQIGNNNPARLLCYQVAGIYRAYHHNGAVAQSSPAAGILPPAIGDLVELRVVLGADGSIRLAQSINGGAEVAPVASAANPLAAGWSEATLVVGGIGAFADYLTLKVDAGVKSLDQMRLLPPVS